MSAAWHEALADYQRKRAYSDGLPLGAPDEDAAVDAYCVAMDGLIVTPAPDRASVALKIRLIRERDCDVSDVWWDALLADIEAPQPPAPEFDAALAEFERCRQAEQAFSPGATLEEEAVAEPALEAIIEATDAAFDAMIAMPVTHAKHAALKLKAIDDQYDVCACGLDRDHLDQVKRELLSALQAGDPA
ncbi:hypothetical protein [Sphingomonas immobilis]|uniref:Uncharacterized protein n=1 Tax=Sphingomonas immobilis TaxID=3063997 RepID=A0ABT9A0S2_9SPHN|nr:hypothetical protein [Sphingomonas sp. CA1-15]MDO7843431.1 hypothetical protein [Sphingomonas sp. CA1-15]